MAASANRVFLSHSSKDKGFVKELYRRLSRDGVRCFCDIESIGWGDNWVRALEKAIDECEYIVFVLSPDFCNSEWVEVERTSSIADDPVALKRKVRPLMLHQCRDLSTFPRFLRAVQAIDVSTNSLFEQNYPRICRELGGVPQADLRTADRTKLPLVHPLPERHRMPYHSLGDKFVGLVGAIWDLYDSLFRDNTTVLQGTGVVSGTGGLGKTQLAIEYAHRLGSAYAGGVYWVTADLGIVEMITQISAAAGIEIDTKVEEEAQVAFRPQGEYTPSSRRGGRTWGRPLFAFPFCPSKKVFSCWTRRKDSLDSPPQRWQSGLVVCRLPLSYQRAI